MLLSEVQQSGAGCTSNTVAYSLPIVSSRESVPALDGLMASCLANGKRNQTYKNWPEPTQTVKKQQVLVKPFPPLLMS